MSKAHERDKAFVEQMLDDVEDFGFEGEDIERLRSLALRGAAVQWRPIKEAPRDGTEVLVYACLSPPEKWHECMRDLPPFIGRCAYHPDAGWCVCEIRKVTHFIPLTALGEPND